MKCPSTAVRIAGTGLARWTKRCLRPRGTVPRKEGRMSCADCGCIINTLVDGKCPNCGGENILMRNEDGNDER